jgi:hypothetical protein
LQAHGAGGGFDASHCGLGSHRIGRIDEYSNTRRRGHQLTQEFKPLCHQLKSEKIDPRQIAARPGEAGDKTERDRVFGGEEDDRDRRRCRLRRKCPKSGDRDEHGHLTTGQIGYQCRQTIVLPLRPAVHDRYVLALDETRVLQAPMKSTQRVHPSDRRCAMEKSDYRHRRLLRACRERPRRSRAAKQRDELAPLHSITSSAMASSLVRGRYTRQFDDMHQSGGPVIISPPTSTNSRTS